MSDLINRDYAIDDLHSKSQLQIWDTEDVEVWVNSLPSAEPRKKGKWLVHGDIPTTCSCCHEDWDKYVNGDIWYSDELPNYCPNCGSYNGGKNEV